MGQNYLFSYENYLHDENLTLTLGVLIIIWSIAWHTFQDGCGFIPLCAEMASVNFLIGSLFSLSRGMISCDDPKAAKGRSNL